MPRVTLIVGQAQQGKTTLALKVLRQEAVRGLILDPVRSKPFSGMEPTFPSWGTLCQFLASTKASGRWIVTLRSMDFPDYVWALRAAPYYRHVTLLVDEGLTFAQDRDAYDPLVKLCRMNAHFGGGLGVPVLITAQRPMDLPADVRSQADRWFSFRQEEPRDLQFLSERCSPSFAEQVAGLAPHKFLIFPPSSEAAEESNDDGQGKKRSDVYGRSAGSPGTPAHDPAAKHRPEAARLDGRRQFVGEADDNGL